MNSHNQLFGVDQIPTFTQFALEILATRSKEELSKLRDKLNGIAQSSAKIPRSDPFNATLINISNFYTLLYRAKVHMLGKTLDESEVEETQRLINSLYALMNAGWMKDSEAGAVVYLVNSYISLGACAVSCAMQASLNITDDALVDCVTSFVTGCVYDQANSEEIVKSAQQIIGFDYREFGRGFRVIDNDNEPKSACEKLIYEFNRMIVDTLLKMRFKVRSSPHHLTRINTLMMQMNLWQLDELRAAFTEDQSRFTLSLDNLEPHNLQALYIPSVCGLAGRVDSESKLDSLKSYLTKSHQLILQLYQMSLIDKDHLPLNFKMIASTIKEMLTSMFLDYRILRAHMIRLKKSNLDNLDVRIQQNDLILINSELSGDIGPLVGQDYDEQFEKSYLVTRSGMHANLKPVCVRLFNKANDNEFISRKLVEEFERLFRKHQSWQDKDGSSEDKSRFARFIKDYFVACLRNVKTDSELKILKAILTSGKIEQLESDPECDKIYDALLILLCGRTAPIPCENIRLYLSEFTQISPKLEHASRTMSVMNFSLFFNLARQITNTILDDKTGELAQYKQEAESCDTYLNKFHEAADHEVKALITAINSPNKKYNPAATITNPNDTKATLTDYLDLAARVMRAESEEQLSALADEIDKLPAHPFLLLDGAYACSQLSYDRCTTHLHDLLKMLFITRKISLQLPVTPAALSSLMKSQAALKLVSAPAVDDRFPTCALKLYFKLAAHLVEIFMNTNTAELANICIDFLNEIRNDIQYLRTSTPIITKTYTASILEQISLSTVTILSDDHGKHSNEQFIAALQSMMLSGLAKARTRSYTEFEQHRKQLASANKKQLDVAQYHESFLSVSIFDNVIARIGSSGKTAAIQAESALVRAIEVFSGTNANIEKVISLAKMPVGPSLAAFRDGSVSKTQLALEIMTRLASLYNTLCRSFHVSSNDVKNKKRADIVYNANIYNDYIINQLSFLESDLRHLSDSSKDLSRELALVTMLKQFIQVCYYDINRAIPNSLLMDILNFNFDDIIFDRYFNEDMSKMIVTIIAKQFDYYATNPKQLKSDLKLNKIHQDITRLIEKHDKTNGEIKKYAARLIMEYYLRLVYLSAITKSTKQAESLHAKVFALCKVDELLPSYRFIYLGYQKLAGFAGEIGKRDVNELFTALSEVFEIKPGVIDDVLNGLSPVLYAYLSGLAQKITVCKLRHNRSIKQPHNNLAILLQKFVNEPLETAIIQEFIVNVSAVNDTLPSALEHVSVHDVESVTLADFFALAAEILAIQNAEQAAPIARKLDEITAKPFIQLESEWKQLQEAVNATSTNLSSMLLMLYVARKQALNLPIPATTLERQQRIIPQLLNTPTERSGQSVLIYLVNMIILQAARVSQYFGTPDHQVDVHEIDCVLSLPRKIRREVSSESFLFPGTATHRLCEEMHGSFDAFLQPTSSNSAAHELMHKLSAMMRARLTVIRKSLEARTKMARIVLSTQEMTLPQRDKMYDCAVQLSLLDVVLVELRPSEYPEVSAHYARFRAAHPLPSIAHSVDSKELDTKTMPPFLALLISRDTLTNSLDDITNVCLRYFSLLHDVFKSRYALCIELPDATKLLDSLIVRELKRYLKDLSLIIESARYVQQSDKSYHERLDILHCIRAIVDIYISYIENGVNALTLKKINTFDYTDITFNKNFNLSIANALEFILSLRLSAHEVDRLNTGVRYEIITSYLNDLETFIAKLKDCTCNTQDGARFIMECYLLICKQALLMRNFDAAEKYHDRIFTLIKMSDPLLPIYTSIYQYLLYVTQTISTDIPRPEFSDSFFKMFSGAESDTIETLNLIQRLPNSLVDLLFKLLWTQPGSTELVTKKQVLDLAAALFVESMAAKTISTAKHQVARYGIYANTICSTQLISLTEPVVAPAAPVVNVTIETEKVEIIKAVPVKAASPRVEPAQAEPPKASPPALCEADVSFEAVCKQFDGVHSDKCFDGIYKLLSEALNGKQHNKAIRAKAAIGLAQALLHRIDETENLKRRESIYKTLQMYGGFINKIDSQMAKTFKQHMKRFGNHLEKLAEKIEVPQSVLVAEVTELAEVSGVTEVMQAAVIAEVAESVSQQDTTVPVQPPPPAIVTEHVKFKIRKLTSADLQFETVCKFCHADDADVCFEQIAKYCNEALSSAKNAVPVRITAALTLARALLYRIDEAATITKRQNAFTTLQGYQTFVVKNMQKVSKELSDYLIAYEAHLAQQVLQVELVRPEEIAQPVIAAEQPIVAAEPPKETAQPKETPAQKKAESSTPARSSLTVFAPAKPATTQQAKNKNVEVKAILKRTPPTSDRPVPSTSTSSVMQRLEPIEPVDDSLLPCRVQPTNRLLDNFAPKFTPCKSKLLNVFLDHKKNVFLYGNAVLSPLFNNKSGHLQLVCRMSKDRLFKFLTDDANHEFPYLQEILELPRSTGYLIRLDENKLQAAKETYDRTDLLIEVRCVSGANNQAALKRFCHEERLTSMLFYDVGNRCLIDTCNHAKYTAVYPVMRIDQRDNLSGDLDLIPANPEFPQSTRDNREIILEALLQLSTHHLYLGCGMKLKQFIADCKPEFYTCEKTQFPIEWLDELFLNHNAWNTARWLDNFDMLYELFPQLDPDYAQDFFTACEQADAASDTKHYSSLSYHEILSQRAAFLLNTFFRSFKQSIKVLDYLVEDGLVAFMETFCRFLRGLLFECFQLDHDKQDIANMDLLELLTQNCWDLIMRDSIPAIYQEFILSHPDVFYKLEDKEQFIHDLVDSLASNGYPNRLWLAQQVWAHHEYLGHQPFRVAFM